VGPAGIRAERKENARWAFLAKEPACRGGSIPASESKKAVFRLPCAWAQLGSNQRPPDYEFYYLVSTGLYRFIFVFSISEIGIEFVHRLVLVFKMSGSKSGPVSFVLKLDDL